MKSSATAWIAENASQLGADGIWIGEDIDRGQDIFVLTAATALRARGIEIGTGIVSIATHDILRLARAADTLQDLSSGRFLLGLGLGGVQDLHNRGVVLKKPVTLMRQTIEVLRQLWSGAPVSIENELFSLKERVLAQRVGLEIPIFLGVRGAQMLSLAGQMADGVILSGPVEYIERAIETVNTAARDSNRVAVPRKVVWLPTVPTFAGVSQEFVRRVVALVVADTPEPILKDLSISQEKLERVKNAVTESGPSEGARYVDSEIQGMFSISGEREEVVDSFDRLGKLGADELVVGPPFSGEWRTALADIMGEVASRRRSQGIPTRS